MADPDLVHRVEVLEDTMERLVRLPERIDALEATMSAGFGALSDRVDELDGRLSARIDALSDRVDALSGRVDALEVSLRQEIRSGDEETRRFMRVLHEDLVGRIALLSEGPRRPQ